MSSHSTAATSRSGVDDDVDTVTPVGVDVGTRQLVAVATADGTVDEAIVVDGDPARELYAEFTEATHQLQEGRTGDTLGDVVWRYWRWFRELFRGAAEAVLEVASAHPAPVVVLEDLPGRRRPLVACRCGNLRAPTWFPAAVQAVVADRVVDAGVPVTYVDPEHTSKQCHRCDRFARDEGATIVCQMPECSVDEVDRDRSAAVSIAKRASLEVDR